MIPFYLAAPLFPVYKNRMVVLKTFNGFLQCMENIKNTCDQVGIYLFKVHNENIRVICEFCSKLTLNTPKRRQ